MDIRSGQTAASKTAVTVLCGFLGAGKTTMVKHLVQHETLRGRKIAAIVNDVAALNIDGSLIAHACSRGEGGSKDAAAGGTGTSAGDKATQAVPSGGEADVLTLQGGSICSALQDDLAAQLLQLAQPGKYDHVFVECSGVTHPAAIAHMFKEHTQLCGSARLHATITVVDCFNLRRVLLTSGGQSTTVEDAWKTVRAEWDDSVTNLYIEQIECASVLVLNKCDTISATEYESCRACVEAFNRRTRPIRASFGRIDVVALVDAPPSKEGLADPSEVLSSRRWLQTLSGAEADAPEKVFRTFVYAILLALHHAQI
eukprot:COSAG01_NODE_1857_length_9044_cov_24.006931_3_plen_313_part_00